MDNFIDEESIPQMPEGGKLNQYGGRKKTRRKKRRKQSKKRRTKRRGGVSLINRGKIALKKREIENLRKKYRKLDPKTQHASRQNISNQAKRLQHDIDVIKNPALLNKELYGKRRPALSQDQLMKDARVLQREDRTKRWNDIRAIVNKAYGATSNDLKSHKTLLMRIQNKLSKIGEKQDFKELNDYLEEQKKVESFQTSETDHKGRTPIDIINSLIDRSFDSRGRAHTVGGRRKKRKKTRRKKRTKKKARKRRSRTRKRGGCFGNCFRKKTRYTLEEINEMVRKANEHDTHVEKYKNILNSNKIKTNVELMKFLEENNKMDDILYAANAFSQLNKPAPVRFGSRSPSPSPLFFERNSPPMITGAPK